MAHLEHIHLFVRLLTIYKKKVKNACTLNIIQQYNNYCVHIDFYLICSKSAVLFLLNKSHFVPFSINQSNIK